MAADVAKAAAAAHLLQEPASSKRQAHGQQRRRAAQGRLARDCVQGQAHNGDAEQDRERVHALLVCHKAQVAQASHEAGALQRRVQSLRLMLSAAALSLILQQVKHCAGVHAAQLGCALQVGTAQHRCHCCQVVR